jgi:chromosome segregation protein
VHLTKLEILGFKSFPLKTELLFDRGVTAIVGPNGCGKTNILDAVRWVLGEQKVSLLRGSKMEEVIFNGTKELTSLGMADVSLTIENQERTLPIDYHEVVIARRVFRSGESEYFLNKAPCRLKDITELFSDTGVGSHAYAVIQQDMIEAIISEKAEDRRFLFEEAAGISKYKHRKKAAIRKLEATENDLLRLRDIITEVEKQVNSLRRQMRRAERFKKVQEELKKQEIGLAKIEYDQLGLKEEELGKNLDSQTQTKDTIVFELSQEDVKLETWRLELVEIEKKLNSLQTEISSLSEKTHHIEREVTVRKERGRNLAELVEKDKKGILELEEKQLFLGEEEEKKKEEMKLISSEINQKETQHSQKETELFNLSETLKQKKLQFEEFKEELTVGENQLSLKESELKGLDSQLASLFAQRENFDKEKDELSQKKEETNQRKVSSFQLHSEKSKRIEQLKNEILKTEEKLAQLQNGLDNLVQGENRIKVELGMWQGKEELLTQMLLHHEGYKEGVKAVFENKEVLPGVINTVANLINTPPEYLNAIESVLGDAAQFLVCQNLESAKRGIDFLQERKLGRATFLILDYVDKLAGTFQKTDFSETPGVIGRADELVETSAPYKNVVKFLLGTTFLVESWEDVLAISEKREVDFNMVTLAGEVIKSNAVVDGGSQKEVYLLGREKELEKANGEIEKLKILSTENQKKKSEIEKEIAAEKDSSEKTSDELRINEQELHKLELEIKEIETWEKNLIEKILNQDKESQEISAKTSFLQSQIDELKQEVNSLKGKRESRSLNLETEKKELEQIEKGYQETYDMVNTLRLEIVTQQGKKERLWSEQKSLEGLLEEVKATLESKKNEIENSEKSISQLTEENLLSGQELKALLDEIGIKTERSQEWSTKQAEFLTKQKEQESKLKSLRQKKEEIQSGLHNLDLEKLKILSQKKNWEEKIYEEYKVELAELPSLAEEEKKELEGALDKISSFKEFLQRMGPVNLLALEEYQKEKERLDFLKKQMADLEQAKSNLHQTISKINQTAKELFLETFDQVKGNFQKVFSELFEGGETGLSLINETDPLESPIEISARPKGKKLLNIAQLSGGEKALTAISLLFALYMIKPSPFCILDEIDAPLDDANIVRFLKLIRHFAEKTQFIIITHNKLSMEAADVLYGVTMEQAGVSKIVSVKFDAEKVSA